jgi:uncharacterized membrane protein
LHLALQLVFNVILPFPNYSEQSGHDGSVYYQIAFDPLPVAPAFSHARYQRILLPLLVWAAFPWNRHLGFLVINAIAVSISTVYFYKIVEERQAPSALRLTLLYAVTPYLFGGVHLGLSEPLMMAGLVSGYYYVRRQDTWKAIPCYAMSVLAKEIAVLPILGEIVMEARRSGLRRALQWSASLVPAAAWYFAVGLRWKDPLWLVSGAQGNVGFGPGSMIELLSEYSVVQGLAGVFMMLNQAANALLLMLIMVGLYRLRSKPHILLWVAPTAVSLLAFGTAVYRHNFDLGRQALPVILMVIGLDGPGLGTSRRLYCSVVIVCLLSCVFWTLYFARFFAYK